MTTIPLSDCDTTIEEEEEESTLDNTPSPVRGLNISNISKISPVREAKVTFLLFHPSLSPVSNQSLQFLPLIKDIASLSQVTPGRRKMTPIKEGSRNITPVKEKRTTPVKRASPEKRTPVKEKRMMFEESKENMPENELDISPIYR